VVNTGQYKFSKIVVIFGCSFTTFNCVKKVSHLISGLHCVEPYIVMTDNNINNGTGSTRQYSHSLENCSLRCKAACECQQRLNLKTRFHIRGMCMRHCSNHAFRTPISHSNLLFFGWLNPELYDLGCKNLDSTNRFAPITMWSNLFWCIWKSHLQSHTFRCFPFFVGFTQCIIVYHVYGISA